jgi:hypothetical protein
MVGRDAAGRPLPMERYALAESAADFWALAAHPQNAVKKHGERFIEFLKRAMLAEAPLTAPADVAWFLASYARDAKARVEAANLPGLAAVRTALEEALGMKFTGERGEHFFRSTLVQTIFYGVFSAWVLWHRERPDRTDAFDWRVAEWTLHVPFIRALYDEVATPSKLGPLGLVEVLDWTAAALNRVQRPAFFRQFQDEHAVQYFYEPFLEAFDPELRKDMGVWYTPPEIVRYQVARVDAVLREELGLPDGLADPGVVVLDPCCGTGAYLVEALECIGRTLRARGGDALLASDLKKAAMERVFGFEILPAPFVVAHLQLGLMLRRLGAPLSDATNERVGVYLTNALTGWEPPKGAKKQLAFAELGDERDAADAVKREARVLVVLGNPPYNAFAGVSPEEEQGLVEPYKKDLNTPASQGGWGIRKFNLDDLYVRFFRLAERRIAEMTGRGVVSFISNFSYLADPSFVAMRQRFLGEFDRLWLDCMNGDSRETGKLTPDGKPDPSVFSTDYNREGIRVGTAVCVIVRRPERDDKPVVRFRHFWGADKRRDLLATLAAADFNAAYTAASPAPQNRFSFRPENVSKAYNAWPKLPDLCEVAPSNGLMEKRGGALIDIDRDALEARMRDYLNPNIDWDEYKARHEALTQKQAGFEPRLARQRILEREPFDPQRLMRYAVRPMETRWCYYTQVNPIWNRARPPLWEQCFDGNAFLLSRMNPAKDPEGAPMYFCRTLSDDHLLSPDAVCFPLRKAHPGWRDRMQAMREEPTANLSPAARAYLAALGVADPDAQVETASLLWMHALAVGYSPAYLAQNADGLRRDWPRVPLPDSRDALDASAALGRIVAALLDTESPVTGVTAGHLDPLLRTVAVLARTGGGALDPAAGDLALTAGWGHAGKGGVTMPGKGRLEPRGFDAAETEALAQSAAVRGLKPAQAKRLLGGDTRDVYLNGTAFWRNVPAAAWDFTIGGYQVVKKWLSYREQPLLGRAMNAEEAREVTSMARRLTALALMQPALDANYRAVREHAAAWPADADK